MTGRTHDLIAFTSIAAVAAVIPPVHLSLATLLVAVAFNVAGGVTPDIDQPTAHLWRKIPAGSLFGKIICPLFGGHRFISHSVVGVVITGIVLRYVLNWMHTFLLVDMQIVWWSFMIGYVSHLVADSFTHEGVPWLFPFSIRLGIPPIKSLRFHTGGLIEKLVIFPGFLLINAYIFASHYSHFLKYLHTYIKY
jgi:inner membrane protein